jgi:hypothetical protein
MTQKNGRDIFRQEQIRDATMQIRKTAHDGTFPCPLGTPRDSVREVTCAVRPTVYVNERKASFSLHSYINNSINSEVEHRLPTSTRAPTRFLS